MKNIFLIRHGQKEAILVDPKLTDLGKKQSTESGKFFQDIPLDIVISSPSTRTKETTEGICSVIKKEYEVDDRLVERMDFQNESVEQKEFIKEWLKATHDRDYDPKFGDSSRKAGQRIEQVIQDINPKYSNILLVTHGGVIIDYLRNIFGDEATTTLRKTYPEGEDFQMYNCAINQVVLGGKPKIKLLNHAKHIGETSD